MLVDRDFPTHPKSSIRSGPFHPNHPLPALLILDASPTGSLRDDGFVAERAGADWGLMTSSPELPLRRGVPTILGIPYDGGSSFMRGAAEAPGAIRDAFHSDASNYWSESGIDLGAPGTIVDAGDISLWAEPDVRAAIERAIERALDQGGRPLSLGGDHSITYPIVRTLRRRMHPHLAVLHIDAHPDLYPEFQGDRFSHACPMARIMEDGLAERMVQVGIRTMNGVQREQADRFGVQVIEMRVFEAATELAFETPLYISIDLDALDPAFAPGVSHREPGGLSVRQVIDVIQHVRAPIVGADIVELNPRMESEGLTATVAAKLLKELAAKMIASPV